MESVTSQRFFSKPLSQIQQSKVVNNDKSLKFASNYIINKSTTQKPSNTLKYSNYISNNSPNKQEILQVKSNDDYKILKEKNESLEIIITQNEREKQELAAKCLKLENDLNNGNNRITEIMVNQSNDKTESSQIKSKYSDLLKNFTNLQKRNEELENKLILIQDSLNKNELLINSYEDKITLLQKEVKTLNESMADKENYIFELKAQKQQPFAKNERDLLKNRDIEQRFLNRLHEQNQEIERLMNIIREINSREDKFENMNKIIRTKEFEIAQMKEYTMNYEVLVQKLQQELAEKNERLQGIDENRLEERININKMQILELQNKLKDSELENSHLSQVIMNPTYPFHRSYPSYNSYHV